MRNPLPLDREHTPPGDPYAPLYRLPPAPRAAPRIHIVLGLVTFLTTSLTGAMYANVDPLRDLSAISSGIPYALALMAILVCHEFGHYLFARYHRVDATLPFFIPFWVPPPFLHFGTLGAFIRMRSLPVDRRALFDIGAAGPWGGFLVAVPVVMLGLSLSEVQPHAVTEGGLVFGESLLFNWLAWLTLGSSPQDVTIVLHPIAVAGWFGLLVTAFNLLPAGQLDGGHVVYSVFGRGHRWVSRGVVVFLGIMGVTVWIGWLVWMGILLYLGVDHPPTLDTRTPLDARRLLYAALTLGVLVVTFMPVPIDIVEGIPPEIFQGPATPVSAPAPGASGHLIAL